MFKKTHITLLLSLLLHVVIVMLLNNSQTMVIPNTSTASTPIKSYIYQAPKAALVAVSNKTPPPPKPKKVKQIKPPLQTKDESHTQAKISLNPKKNTEISDVKSNENSTNMVKNNASKKTAASKQTFSYKALHQLREKIQQQTNDQLRRELAQPNSGSIMHGTPTLVPHSTIAVSDEEKTKQATTTMSADKKIIKGDDGSCLLVEDLSVVGMEGITAVSGFSCGETKFNKRFREHMKKVRKKTGKK